MIKIVNEEAYKQVGQTSPYEQAQGRMVWNDQAGTQQTIWLPP